MVPEWISWGVPFVTGVSGVYVGLKVGIARLEVRYEAMKSKIDEVKETLRSQVGETRCREYRTDCKETIHSRLDDISGKLDKLNDSMINMTVKIAKIDKATEE